MKNHIFKTYNFNQIKMKKSTILLAVTVALTSNVAMAKISAEDAAKLGKELTPMGCCTGGE